VLLALLWLLAACVRLGKGTHICSNHNRQQQEHGNKAENISVRGSAGLQLLGLD
jgi:hypothetical protein